ncbi:MAG: carbon-nitrogen hydrolase family protein, partial [Pseudomonadota bacterium]|nr:carbon-nitrogen hydrolase family protein [Pseudomonadota bacterium]
MPRNGQRWNLRIGAAQFDLVANANAHVAILNQTGGQGVDVPVFPELSLPRYASTLLTDDPARCVIDQDGPALVFIRDACRQISMVAVVGGCLPNARGLGLSALVIDRRGDICATYDNQHLDGPEKNWFVPGEAGYLISVHGWRLVLGICYDSSFPEHGWAAAMAGADAYLVGGAFPLGRSDKRRAIYFPARALENTVYVTFANFVGGHDGLDYGGRSVIYSPDGGKLDEVSDETTAIAMADFHAETLRETRETLRMLHDRRAEQAPIHTTSANSNGL